MNSVYLDITQLIRTLDKIFFINSPESYLYNYGSRFPIARLVDTYLVDPSTGNEFVYEDTVTFNNIIKERPKLELKNKINGETLAEPFILHTISTENIMGSATSAIFIRDWIYLYQKSLITETEPWLYDFKGEFDPLIPVARKFVYHEDLIEHTLKEVTGEEFGSLQVDLINRLMLNYIGGPVERFMLFNNEQVLSIDVRTNMLSITVQGTPEHIRYVKLLSEVEYQRSTEEPIKDPNAFVLKQMSDKEK